MNHILHFGVGIDTARYGHHVSFLTDDKRTAAKPFHFKEDRTGYDQFRKALESLRAKAEAVCLHIRLDAAGQYANNLLHWLYQLPFPDVSISVGKPSKNKAYRDAHYDKRKADPVESLACARFAIVERPGSSQVTPVQFAVLRSAVAALEAASSAKTRLVNQLHALIACSFPELPAHVSIISKSHCLELLERYPTAKRLAAARLQTIQAIPYMKPDLAKTLHELAKVSTASAICPVQEALIKAKVQEIRLANVGYATGLKIVKQAWDSLPDGPHRRIYSIKGIGLQTAAALVAKIVSIDRFTSSSSLIGYFGVFPEQVADSGTTPQGQPKLKLSYRISKKGNDLVRRLLYTAAQSAILHNAPVRECFARQMALGKSYNVAVGHCMAKLLRQVFAVWTKDKDFNAKHTHADCPEAIKQTDGAKQHSDEIENEKEPVDPIANEASQKSKANLEQKRKPLNFVLLKSKLSILDILKQKGWKETTRKGSQLRGSCPIHASQTHEKSFAVNSAKNTYCCHSCGSKGGAIELLMAYSKLPLLEAAWQWIDQSGMEPPTL